MCCAAFLVQLEGVLTKNFHETLKPKKEVPKWLWWPTLVTGHIGFLARAAVFMFVAIMFFRTVQHSGGSGGETAIGNALAVLKVLPALGVLIATYAKVFMAPHLLMWLPDTSALQRPAPCQQA